MKRFYPLLLGIMLLCVSCVQFSFAQSKSNSSATRKAVTKTGQPVSKPKVRFINPKMLAKPPGYTHVVEVTGGRTVYIAGQIALDSAGNVVGRGDFRAQTEQVFENLKTALES